MEPLPQVLAYHERTKHHLDRYAASLGYMDWSNQPNPFRTFAGAKRIELEHPLLRTAPSFDRLFESPPHVAPIDRDSVSRLFFHSLALSAWKQTSQSSRWSLRINPSSGALHPTEGYLVCGAVPGLNDVPGVFHYAPFLHALERRCRLTDEDWSQLTESLPRPCLLIGFTSIYWREAWKYGERAFRYCHHDVGHAVGSIALAARTLGWDTRLLPWIADADLSQLLGTHLQQGIEAEHADGLLVVYPTEPGGPVIADSSPFSDAWRASLAKREFQGQPNRLSRQHHSWPVIDEVSRATEWNPPPTWEAAGELPAPMEPAPGSLLEDRGHSAEQIIRQRRSAVDLDGRTSISRQTFYHILSRTIPRPGRFPFAVLPWRPQVSLAIFVHRVDGLQPGLYLLVRHAEHEPSLRQTLRTGFDWARPPDCPDGLNLYVLVHDDARRAAKVVSCHQDIAADGAFALGMLAEFEPALRRFGAAFYPRLFWETGLVGQVLYLEAEAAGIRGTGIGCYFDDAMHDVLGLTNHTWQSLYHFTIGGPVDDPRLKTIPPYAHLWDATE